jgi:pimeloyl-ACP methyl ester carboxylesterase
VEPSSNRRAAAAVFTAVLLAGCRRPAAPVAQAATPDEVPARSDVTVHHLTLANGFYTVDVLVPTAFPSPRPAVISLLDEHDAFLDAGLAVVSYQIHWELLKGPAATPPTTPPQKTYGKWLLASSDPRTIGQGYLQLIVGNAEDTVPKVIDALSALPDVDVRRLGIAGTSTNGFLVLQALMADHRLSVGAAIVACGDYHRFLQASSLAMDGGPLELDQEYESWLHTKEPIRHPERIVHAALLMMNGADDRAIPVRCAVETARAFRHAYRRAGQSRRFKFVLLTGKGHDIAAEAREQVHAWLRRWLLRRPLPREPGASGAKGRASG